MSAIARAKTSRRRSDRAAVPPTRGPGRPPRLSREGVVKSVVDLLGREPKEAVTIARVAAEVGASPAALYRHFDNLDDLLDSVLASVLAEVDAGVDVGDPWERQLEEWMRGLRIQLLRVPAVIALIGRSGRTSPAWLNASSVLVEILKRAGLTESALAITYLWILETTTGLVLQEAVLPVSEQLANARASRRSMSEHAATRFAAIGPALDEIDGDEFFSFVVEQAKEVVSSRRKRNRG